MRKLVLLLAACGPKAGTTVHNDRGAETMTIAERGVGLIDEKTHVTLTSMRTLFPGYDITPLASQGNTVFDVTKSGEKVMSVSANDDGSVFGVNVTTGSIANPTHNWRVGAKMPPGVIDTCNCDSEPAGGEVAICFKAGEHVAVVFSRPCIGMFDNGQQRTLLVGATISKLAWQSAPWQAGLIQLE